MEPRKLEVTHNGIGKVKKLNPEEKKLYDILVKLPSSPKDFNLSKDQKRWWLWFGKEFLSTKKLVKLDLIWLSTAAVALDKRNKIVKKINALNDADDDGVAGWVQVFQNKTTNITGYQTGYNQATDELKLVSKYFGIGFTERQAIQNPTSGDPNQLSLLDQISEMLHK